MYLTGVLYALLTIGVVRVYHCPWPSVISRLAESTAPVCFIIHSLYLLLINCDRTVTAYLSAFFSLPVTTSLGEKLTHEEVVARLDDETVSYENELGIQGYFAETFRISIKVEREKYEDAIRWMKDLIYGAEFDATRYHQPGINNSFHLH